MALFGVTDVMALFGVTDVMARRRVSDVVTLVAYCLLLTGFCLLPIAAFCPLLLYNPRTNEPHKNISCR